MTDVLLVRMSSLGDIVHTLPAVTDAARQGARIDWVVEENYVPLVDNAAGVDTVLSIALRRWRTAPLAHLAELRAFLRRLRRRRYDLVLDAQGLLKSAVVARSARGREYAGYDAASVRERPAALAYGKRVSAASGEHAVARCRRLFANVLGYRPPGTEPDFGLPLEPCRDDAVVLAHGTTWATKLWPESFWIDVARRIAAAGLTPTLPWVATERQRALRIAAAVPKARVCPPTTLGEAMKIVAKARGVVGVDTGLAHLAAAAGTPTVMVFGPTDIGLTGCRGRHARNLSATLPCSPCRSKRCLRRDAVSPPQDAMPCLTAVAPARVWSALAELMRDAAGRQDDSTSRLAQPAPAA